MVSRSGAGPFRRHRFTGGGGKETGGPHVTSMIAVGVQLATVALPSPLREQRRVQLLTTKQGAGLALSRSGVCLLHDRRAVLGGEARALAAPEPSDQAGSGAQDPAPGGEISVVIPVLLVRTLAYRGIVARCLGIIGWEATRITTQITPGSPL